jgi:hypothetical protein
VQVNDVDVLPLTEDELTHARMPSARHMPEVDTRFQKFSHRHDSQSKSPLVCQTFCGACECMAKFNAAARQSS